MKENLMRILYIHGFGSHYDPNHEKIQMLKTLGTVVGVNVDYCNGFTTVFDTALDAVIAEEVDLIVGTSMGGYLAAQVGARAGVPFVALNPATSPVVGLQKWVGTFTDYADNDKCLTPSIVESYPDIVQQGAGLVIVESGDEIISAVETVALLENVFRVELFSGGSHRFTNLKSALPIIQEHIVTTSTYGIE
jgi:predicted esterase YcpF (UPF0227 family)